MLDAWTHVTSRLIDFFFNSITAFFQKISRYLTMATLERLTDIEDRLDDLYKAEPGGSILITSLEERATFNRAFLLAAQRVVPFLYLFFLRLTTFLLSYIDVNCIWFVYCLMQLLTFV